MRLVIDKREFLRELQPVQRVLSEYEQFLQESADAPDRRDQAMAMAHTHQRRLRQARTSLRSMELAGALVRRALNRVEAESLHFRLPPGADDESADPAPITAEDRSERLGLLIAELQGLLQQAPLSMQDRLRVLMASISGLFSGIIAQQSNLIDEAVEQINLLTSNRESQNLIREIALIARDIYNSLNSFSSELPLDDLSGTAEGISDAVRKLRGVIQKLEAAANQNLDALDAEMNLDKENDRRTSTVLDSVRETQQQLGQIKLNHPSLTAPLAKLQDRLGDEIGSLVMMLRNRIEVNQESLVSMMANQSFQDLTGQALKKIIAFIEGLEMQVLKLVQKYRPVLGLNSPKPATAPAAEPVVEAQNQDQVDSLLADLGF